MMLFLLFKLGLLWLCNFLVIFSHNKNNFEWNEVNLLHDWQWNGHRIYSDNNKTLKVMNHGFAILTLDTSSFRGFQKLHDTIDNYEENMIFQLDFKMQACCMNETSQCYNGYVTLIMDGINVETWELNGNQDSIFAKFSLFVDNDTNKSVAYRIGISFQTSTSNNIVAEFSLVTLTYQQQPGRVDASTIPYLSDQQYTTTLSEENKNSARSPSLFRRSEHSDSYYNILQQKKVPIPKICDLLGSADAVLLNKVKISGTTVPTAAAVAVNNESTNSTMKPSPIRLFCGIYTTAE